MIYIVPGHVHLHHCQVCVQPQDQQELEVHFESKQGFSQVPLIFLLSEFLSPGEIGTGNGEIEMI